MIVQRGVAFEYAFQAPTGGTPTIRIAQIPFGGAYILSPTSSGISEAAPGQYAVALSAINTNGTYVIITAQDGVYAAEELYITEAGAAPTFSSGANAKLILDTAGLTGLVGTVGIKFIDSPGTTVLTARSTSGITEETGTGIYAWSGVLPSFTGTMLATWDTGGASPVYAGEEITISTTVTGGDVVSTADTLITRVWVDDYTLYDVDDADSLITLTQGTLRGFITGAKPRDELEARVDDDGGLDVTQYYDARVFDPFEGKIRADSFGVFLNAHNTLSLLFALGTTHTLGWELGDGTTRQVVVRAASELAVDMIGRSSHAAWSIQLVAPDPMLVSNTLKSATLDPFASNVSGLGFPLVFPLALAGVSSATITITNEGTRTARPIYTLRGPWSAPFVENATTGERIYTNELDLAEDEALVIDTKNRTVSYQGVEADDNIDWERSIGPWPLIPRGSSVLRAGGTPATGAELQVDYRDTYV